MLEGPPDSVGDQKPKGFERGFRKKSSGIFAGFGHFFLSFGQGFCRVQRGNVDLSSALGI